MNKIEIKPTIENIIDMLDKDLIGRNQYISTFLEMLDNTDQNFTIFVNGNWGTGKTFFVKQVYVLLTYYNQYIKDEFSEYNDKLEKILKKNRFKDLKLENNFVPIYYNAWSNDSHVDPINSIIFNIIKEHNILKDYQEESSSIINKIASVVDVINIFSSGSAKELVDTFKSEDIVSEITTMENLKEKFNTLLDKLLGERGDKLVVFIDELDRCNPIYAIKLLERIKHFFDHENIIFVFSININELTNTISNYYGKNFDSYGYLNKFFDVSIDLPQINITNFMKFLGLEENLNWFNKIIFEFINCYHFTMRDCIRYYQSIKVVEEFVNSPFEIRFNEEKGKEIIKIFILPILLGIKIIDLKAYIDIINGNGYDKFSKVIDNLDVAKKGLFYYMDKDEDGKISKDSFNIQFLNIYNAIFNHGDNYREYSNSEITLDRDSYNYMMDALSLLKKGLKY